MNTSFNPLKSIFKHFIISLLFVILGFIIAFKFLPEEFISKAFIFLFILSFVLIFLAILSKFSLIPKRFSMIFTYIFTFIEGIMLYPILNYFLQEHGIKLLFSTVFATSLIFILFVFLGLKNENNFILNWRKALLISLLAILVISLLNIFLNLEFVNLLLSILGVIIFSLYILYDISLIKEDIAHDNIKDSSDIALHVLSLYLDFINIFIDLVNIDDIIDAF